MTQSASHTGESGRTGPLLVALGAAFVGLAPIGARLSEMGPQATAFWRFLLAAPLLALLLYFKGVPLKRPHPFTLIMGASIGLYMCVWHASLEITSVANATFIVNVGSVSVGLLAWAFLKQRPSRLWPIAAIVTLAGAATMSFGGANGGSGNIQGDLIAVVAAFFMASYVMTAGLAQRHQDTFNVMFWGALAAAMAALLASLIVGEKVTPNKLTDLSGPIFLAFFAQFLGQSCIIFGVGKTPPSVAGVILMLQPVVSGVIAWPLFQENLSIVQILGAVGILAGVYLANLKTK